MRVGVLALDCNGFPVIIVNFEICMVFFTSSEEMFVWKFAYEICVFVIFLFGEESRTFTNGSFLIFRLAVRLHVERSRILWPEDQLG